MGTPLDLRGPWKIRARKAVDSSIYLHGGPFRSEGNLESGGGACRLRTLKNECRRALVMGHLSAKDSIKGILREGNFTRDIESYVKQGSEMGICFYRGSAFG